MQTPPARRSFYFSDPGPFAGQRLVCIRGERVIFRDLSFCIGSGDALVLLGPNGSGKSSLLRLMALLLRPVGGALTWADAPVADDPDAHGTRTRYVGHLDAVKPVLTVAENVAFWAGVAGCGADGVARSLETFRLSKLAARPGRLLSAGQKRRVNLARLIAAPAPLWLLDEPTTALDRDSIRTLEAEIADHRRKGGMVVVSTHQDIDMPGACALHLDQFSSKRRTPA